MNGEARRAARGQRLAIALILAYLVTLVGYGPRIIPAGYLVFPVVVGPFSDPGKEMGVILGWLGTGIMFLRIVLPAEPPPWVDLAGSALLAGSLVALARWGGNPELLRVTGLPFGAVALILLASSLRAAPPSPGG